MTSRGTALPPIGAHVQVRGGLARGGLASTDAVGARAVQVFVGDPRGWRPSAGVPHRDAFTAGCAERGVPSLINTPFLVNVASSDPRLDVGPAQRTQRLVRDGNHPAARSIASTVLGARTRKADQSL